MSARELNIPPPVWFIISLAVAYGLDWLIPSARLSVAGLPQIGVVLAIISVLFALAAIRGFRRHETTIHPNNPGKTSALVMEGPFRLSRNPMYVGLVGVLLAAVCSLQNPVSLLALPFLIWAVTRFQIVPEERILAANFGEPYADFCRRAPLYRDVDQPPQCAAKEKNVMYLDHGTVSVAVTGPLCALERADISSRIEA